MIVKAVQTIYETLLGADSKFWPLLWDRMVSVWFESSFFIMKMFTDEVVLDKYRNHENK